MIRYHLRLVWVYLLYRLKPSLSPISRISWRVRYRDCDVNGHMNNAVYLFYLDAARFDLFFRSGLLKRLRARHARPIVGRVNISYRRELRPRQRFTVESFLEGIEGKLLLMRHNILVGKTLHATAQAGVLVIENGRVTNPSFLTDMISDPNIDSRAVRA